MYLIGSLMFVIASSLLFGKILETSTLKHKFSNKTVVEVNQNKKIKKEML